MGDDKSESGEDSYSDWGSEEDEDETDGCGSLDLSDFQVPTTHLHRVGTGTVAEVPYIGTVGYLHYRKISK